MIETESTNDWGQGTKDNPYTFNPNITNCEIDDILVAGAELSWKKALEGQSVYFKLNHGTISISHSNNFQRGIPVFEAKNETVDRNDLGAILKWSSLATSLFTLKAISSQLEDIKKMLI